MSKKTQTPREAKTFDEICELPRDHKDCKDFCIMIDVKYVWLDEQKLGEKPKQEIEIPRKVFDRLIDWYNGGAARK